MGSVRRYGRTANVPLRAPSRSRLLSEVQRTPVRRGARLEAARHFEAAGMAIQHVPIDAPGQSFTALYLNPRKMEEEVAQKLRHIPSRANVYFANSALRSTLEKMQWALAGLTPADSMYLESLCLVAVLELCVVQKESLVAATQPAGRLARSHEQRIAEYVEANLGKDIGLNDLAQLAGLSRFHFLRAFRKTTAETPYQYLLRRRIARAQTMLQNGNMSITEIASAVGFRDSTRFIKANHTWHLYLHETACFPVPEAPSPWVRFPSPALLSGNAKPCRATRLASTH
jgi:AraC-like DNA-binding protein